MHDDLDLRVIERDHDADPSYHEALRQRVAAILDGSEAPPTDVTAPDAVVALDTHRVARPKRHRRLRDTRVARPHWLLAACAALVTFLVGTLVWLRFANHVEVPATAPETTSSPVGDVAGAWAPAGRLNEPCGFRCAAVVLDDGRVLVAPDEGLELYDPASVTFEVVETNSTMGGEVSFGQAAMLDDGRVLLLGGSELAVFDPGTDTLQPLGLDRTFTGIPIPLVLPEGDVLLFGRASDRTRFVNGAFLLDMVTHATALVGESTVAERADFADTSVVPLGDGSVLVADSIGAEMYDPEAGVFTPLEDNPITGGVTATVLLDGRVLYLGGATATVYDPATHAFAATGPIGDARIGHAAARLTDGHVLVIGGFDDDGGPPLQSAELFDPSTGAFAPAASPLASRQLATAVPLDGNRALVFGDYPGNGGIDVDGPGQLHG